MRTCPYCAEEIKDAAIKCRFCGSDLTVAPKGAIESSLPARGPEETEEERKERRPPPPILPGLGGDVSPSAAPVPSEPIPGQGPQVPGATGPTPPYAAPAPGPLPPVAPAAGGPVPPGGPPARPRLRFRRLGARRIALTTAAVAVAASVWTVAILEREAPSPSERGTRPPGAGNQAPSPEGGELIAFTRALPGGRHLIVGVNPETGEERILVRERIGDPQDPAWSPDGTKLAYVEPVFEAGGGISESESPSAIFVLDVTGGTLTTVNTPGLLPIEPTWSPDGSRLGFVGYDLAAPFDPLGSSNLYVVDVTSEPGHVEIVTEFGETHWAGDPAWSPDGKRIAFTSSGVDGGSVYVIPAGGGRERHLARRLPLGIYSEPTWSPDGSQIAFSGGEITYTPYFEVAPSRIFLANPDGTDVRSLTPKRWNTWSPSWSPDGSRIAFVSGTDQDAPLERSLTNTAVYVVGVDGSGPVRVTFHRGADSDPAWQPFPVPVLSTGDVQGSATPSGSVPQTRSEELLFTRDLAPALGTYRPALFLANGDGSDVVKLPEEFAGGYHAWSPDGTRIAFTFRGNLYVMAVDGGKRVRLTRGPAEDSGPVFWSPDGMKILFFRFETEDNGRVFVIELDSQRQTPLTGNTNADRYAWTAAPWAPHGSLVAVVDTSYGNTDIFVIDADGKRRTNLTEQAGEDFAPAWSPDGKTIAFLSDRDHVVSNGVLLPEVYVVDPARGIPMRLTRNKLGESDLAWSPQGLLAFVSSALFDHLAGAIQIVDLDRGLLRTLIEGEGGFLEPAWSPDGSTMAFTRRTLSGRFRIYLVDVEAMKVMAFTQSHLDESDPIWRPTPSE